MKNENKPKESDKLIRKAKSSPVGVDWQMIRLMKESDWYREKTD